MGEGILDLTLLGMLLVLSVGALHGRDLFGAVLLFVAFGLVLAIVWARLGAADLALAEAVIGAGLTGTLLFATLARLPATGHSGMDPMRGWLAGGVLLVPLGLLVQALWPLAALHPELPGQLAAVQGATGTDHPVTAVLLNIRSWDTVLEMTVILLALLGARQLQEVSLETAQPWPLLQAWVRLLAPILLLAAGYLLWRGGHGPGGAFQAGALLASGLVLLRLAHLLPALPWHLWALRLWVVAGLLVFLAVAVGTAWWGDGWLTYPPRWVGALIVGIEVMASLSIAACLALLVIGECEAPLNE